MVVDNTSVRYGLDRKAASKLLKVSIRTVDRYIKSKKLSTQLVDGRIWLNKNEVEVLKLEKEAPVAVDNVNMSTPEMSTDVDMDKVDNIEVFEQGNVHTLSTQKRKAKGENGVYKRLYGELKEELGEKQERLEIANYRVGQLEAQVRNSIPMLEYHRENFERKQHEEDLEKKIAERESLVKKLSTKLKYENFNKRVFLIILLAVLALQPLWLFYIYKG